MDTWETLREQFPVCRRINYLNHAAVSPLPLCSRQKMQEHLDELVSFGASRFPEKLFDILATTRSLGAKLLHTKPEQVFFVRSTTQGLGIVATGLPVKPGDNVVLVEHEFPANLRPWMPLRRMGVEVRMVAQKKGRVLLEDLASSIDQRTQAVSISFVQFLSGFRVDLQAISELCRKNDALFVVDAIQGLGVFPLQVEAMGIDFLSADSHKWLLGPAGIGLGYASNRALDRIQPALEGWLSVEKPFDFFDLEQPLKATAARYEDSAYNIVGLYGLAGSLELILELGVEKISERIITLTDYLVESLLSRTYQVLSPRDIESEKSGIVLARKEGQDTEQLLQKFKANSIEISTRAGSLRISPHAYNTIDELDQLLRIIS